MIAFQSEVAGRSQVWVKNLAQGDPLQITFLDPGATQPRWSPKGEQIFFQYRGGIWSAPPLGGQPRPIIEQGRSPSFSRDGEQLAFETTDGSLWIAKADGSNRRRVIKGTVWTASPALSPDGRAIAYFQNDAFGAPTGDFWVVPASGGNPRQLTFDSTDGGRPDWTPDGRFIIFSSSRGGSETLWRVPASGGPPEPVTIGAGQDLDPAISPDGKRLVYTNIRRGHALMIFDPSTGQERELLERRSGLHIPRFSPEGDRIAFFHVIETSVHLFTIRADGSDVRQLTYAAGERNLFPHWSADGAFLFFTRDRPDKSFRKMPATGGDSTELASWGADNYAYADPLGRAVVYMRSENKQPTASVIRDLQTGSETVLELRLDALVRWFRDGQAVVGSQTARADGRPALSNLSNVVLCHAGTGKCQEITRGSRPTPSGDGSRIFFFRQTDSPSAQRELWSVARDGRNEKRIGTLGPFGFDTHFDVSLDDRIVFVQSRRGKAEIWRAELQ